MEFMKSPLEIERQSMEIIARYVEDLNLNFEEKKIYSRIIHAAGDVELAPLIKIHPLAIDAIKSAIEVGGNIFTDVQMVRSGINKLALRRYGGKIYCRIADDDTKRYAALEGITRSMAAMRLFGERLNKSVVVIGNAPTALFEVLKLVREGILPAAIIGVPVGFVGAADSKEELAAQEKIPFITVSGTKGGSSIAAAIVNAILYLMKDELISAGKS